MLTLIQKFYDPVKQSLNWKLKKLKNMEKTKIDK